MRLRGAGVSFVRASRAGVSFAGASRARVSFAALLACAALAACSTPTAQPAPGRAPAAQTGVPAWVFPLGAPARVALDGAITPTAATSTAPAVATATTTATAPAPAPPAINLIHLPNSTAAFTRAQLTNRFAAPDWYPSSHAPMPEVVARGRAPDLYACGYCHTPGGQGRPENAPLAGLPSEYIVQQVLDFKSGARRALLPGVFPPADLMIHEAMTTTPAEAQIAAEYFSREKLRPRVIVIERSRVPQTQVAGSVYTPIASASEEPLGTRLIELARDSEQHENRDEQMRYVAYVPPGSVARGRALARTGGDHGLTVACVTCHGKTLQGMGPIPPLAGRSPSYLLRQLLAFQTGARSGPATQPMQPVVANLDIGHMIDVVAFAASLRP
jgi:cytochrome c553